MDIAVAREQVERFMTDTMDARELSQKCRDYVDHKQWTAGEAAKLNSRGQAPIVVNRVRPKVKGLVGLYNIRKTDPKAYPRTKKHEKSAHAITDCLRYVADANVFENIRMEVADEFFVEGYGGVFVGVNQTKRGDVNVTIEQIPWDRIYFDPHSRKKDFSDARYVGMYLWMYTDEAKEKWPKVDFENLAADAEYTDETTEDRPRWVDRQRNRVRVAVHFAIEKGAWQMGIFSGSTWLEEMAESPYHDDEGEPCCPIELVSANINRDNERYGEVAGFLDQQDEINHRRSKALHLLNQRQTHGRKGAVKDVKALKREMAKPDGHVEWEGQEWGKDFGVIQTADMLRGQVDLYMDAKAELDAVSFNAQLAGERQQGELSGRAIEKLQAAGTIELNQDYAALVGWEKRVYRQVWGRVKEYWTAEKWIRVTDDQNALRWVGLNSQMTMREYLEENVNDESLSIQDRRKFGAVYQQAIAGEAQQEDPALAEEASAFLDQIVPIKMNDVAELDVDIILDQSFDSVNVQEEQFKMLMQFAQGGDVDIIELIELSQIRGKDALIEKIEKRRQAAMEAQGNLAQIQAKTAEANLMKIATEADKTQAQATQVKIENQMLLTQPAEVTSVAV